MVRERISSRLYVFFLTRLAKAAKEADKEWRTMEISIWSWVVHGCSSKISMCLVLKIRQQ